MSGRLRTNNAPALRTRRFGAVSRAGPAKLSSRACRVIGVLDTCPSPTLGQVVEKWLERGEREVAHLPFALRARARGPLRGPTARWSVIHNRLTLTRALRALLRVSYTIGLGVLLGACPSSGQAALRAARPSSGRKLRFAELNSRESLGVRPTLRGGLRNPDSPRNLINFFKNFSHFSEIVWENSLGLKRSRGTGNFSEKFFSFEKIFSRISQFLGTFQFLG